MKFTNWNGQSLKGQWIFTIKVDGIQARKFRGRFYSKNNNLLYNIPNFGLTGQIFEVYCGSWNETMSIVRASKSERRQVKLTELYQIYPAVSDRLYIGMFTDPSAELIRIAFAQALSEEFEGLVLRQSGTDNYIKVKPSYTEDIIITGFQEGKGKHKGRLGKILTNEGGVGTGFSDEQRKALWDKELQEKILGKYIEVEATEKFPNGKLRHPRFIRLRLDK